MYIKDDEEGWKQSRQHNGTLSMDVAAKILGVRYLFQPLFGAYRHNKRCRTQYAWLALSLVTLIHSVQCDERCATFRVNHWHRRRKYNHDNEELPVTYFHEVWFAGHHADFVFRFLLESALTLTSCIRRHWGKFGLK